MSEAPLILVIDDDALNLKLLNRTLQAAGYRVALANSGRVGLELLERRSPDLILCDIVMPEMDGYAVCRQLKASPPHSEIPLIFLSGQTQTENLLAGFEAGAVDYVTKPFSQAEVLARVRTHTELKRARDTILQNNQQLQVLNRHLASLNQEKNQFLTMAAHDLKNPLTTVLLRTDLAREQLEEGTTAELNTQLDKIAADVEGMRRIVSNLLDIDRIESGGLEVQRRRFDLAALGRELAGRFAVAAERKGIRLKLDLPAAALWLCSDEQLVHQLGDNLLSNALKYSPAGTEVTLRVAVADEEALLEVRDQGPGFSAQDRVRMFRKFTPLSARPTAGESSTGLGLSIVHLLVNLLEARLEWQSAPGEGARFEIRFGQGAADAG